MNKGIYKLECISTAFYTAVTTGDIVKIYRTCYALLNEILTQHKELETECNSIIEQAKRLDTVKDELTVSNVHEYHSNRGYGRSGSSGYRTGRKGNKIKPFDILDHNKYAQLIADICYRQSVVNETLTILKQYAIVFTDMRDKLTQLRPHNEIERLLQNILLVSVPSSMWGKEQQTHNPILGLISGRFAHEYCHYAAGRLLKSLTTRKGKIGRKSELAGRQWLKSNQWKTKNERSYERYVKGRTIAARSQLVQSYVSQSAYYKLRLGWIVGLHSVSDALRVLPFVDSWKIHYESVNRLNYITAAKKNPYVKTVCIERPVQIGEMTVLECSVPIYHTAGYCWEQSGGRTRPQYVYYLGRSGSAVVDKILEQCDWYHNETRINPDDINQIVALIRTFERRLSYALRQKQTEQQRRKEIACYARKLIWLESMNMTDSKNAGNCLPGTIQFAKSMNLPCPADWKDYTIDTRELLRKWKAKSYDCDRLFFPAIDAAVNRVKQTLLSVTSYYTPSVVK